MLKPIRTRYHNHLMEAIIKPYATITRGRPASKGETRGLGVLHRVCDLRREPRIFGYASVRGRVPMGSPRALCAPFGCPAIGVDATFRPYVFIDWAGGEVSIVGGTRLSVGGFVPSSSTREKPAKAGSIL